MTGAMTISGWIFAKEFFHGFNRGVLMRYVIIAPDVRDADDQCE
jgi:hypothetical protein